MVTKKIVGRQEVNLTIKVKGTLIERKHCFKVIINLNDLENAIVEV